MLVKLCSRKMLHTKGGVFRTVRDFYCRFCFGQIPGPHRAAQSFVFSRAKAGSLAGGRPLHDHSSRWRRECARAPQRIRRPNAHPRPGPIAAPGHRGRPHPIADFLRPARHRQDLTGPDHRPPDQKQVRAPQRRGIQRRRHAPRPVRRRQPPGKHGASTILFIDEIHRFNKGAAGRLLPDVESGVIRLIGATTHNPFFFVNSPLVSRSQIFELRPLTEADLLSLLQRALADEERGLGYLKISAEENALRHLAKFPTATRKGANALEIAALTTATTKKAWPILLRRHTPPPFFWMLCSAAARSMWTTPFLSGAVVSAAISSALSALRASPSEILAR